MWDAAGIAGAVAIFAIAVIYVWGCERARGGQDDV